MKDSRTIFFLLILCSSGLMAHTVVSDSAVAGVTRSVHDKMFAPDKGHHFMVSAFLAGFSYYAFRQEAGVSQSSSNTAAATLTLSIGLAKEIYDGVSKKGTPSLKDFVADAAGIAAAMLILNLSSE